MVALISPTFSFRRMLTSCLPSRIACRASRTQVGHSESVSRGQPRGGFTFWFDFSSGLSDQFGVKLGFGLIRLNVSNTVQAPRAAMVRPFSTYLIGLCIDSPAGTGPLADPRVRKYPRKSTPAQYFHSRRADPGGERPIGRLTWQPGPARSG